MSERLTVLAGVENLTDENYREHFDFAASGGRTVQRPGVNFYFGSQLDAASLEKTAFRKPRRHHIRIGSIGRASAWTPVSRSSRPRCFTVKRCELMPMRLRIVALRSRMWTGSLTML